MIVTRTLELTIRDCVACKGTHELRVQRVKHAPLAVVCPATNKTIELADEDVPA